MKRPRDDPLVVPLATRDIVVLQLRPMLEKLQVEAQAYDATNLQMQNICDQIYTWMMDSMRTPGELAFLLGPMAQDVFHDVDNIAISQLGLIGCEMLARRKAEHLEDLNKSPWGDQDWYQTVWSMLQLTVAWNPMVAGLDVKLTDTAKAWLLDLLCCEMVCHELRLEMLRFLCEEVMPFPRLAIDWQRITNGVLSTCCFMDITYLENNLIHGGAGQSYVFCVLEYLQDHGHLEEPARELQTWQSTITSHSHSHLHMPLVGRFLQHMLELAGAWAQFLLARLLSKNPEKQDPNTITELYRSLYIIYLLAGRGSLVTACLLKPVCETGADSFLSVVESVVDWGWWLMEHGSENQMDDWQWEMQWSLDPTLTTLSLPHQTVGAVPIWLQVTINHQQRFREVTKKVVTMVTSNLQNFHRTRRNL